MSYFPSVSHFALYSPSYFSAISQNRFMAPVQGRQNRQNISIQGQQNGQNISIQGQQNGQNISIQGQQHGQNEQSIPNIPGAGQKVSGKGDYDTYECQTCKNRKYQDGSNDPGVSYKTPTNISPERAAYAIRSHEAEHVARARVKALEEDKEILSQSVSYRTAICPECGRTFMAGGTTRTVFRSAPETYSQEPVKKGVYLDRTA